MHALPASVWLVWALTVPPLDPSLIIQVSLKFCLFMVYHLLHSRMAMAHLPLQEVPLAQLSPLKHLLAQGIQSEL
jgi:hypothetical protein